jgi:hypothetical protein
MIDFDEFDNTEELNGFTLDLEEVRSKLPTYPTKKLCEMVVCDRYFGCFKEIAIMCMEELSNRRIAGDDFDFESYIDQAHKQLPKLSLNIPNLQDVLKQVIGKQ